MLSAERKTLSSENPGHIEPAGNQSRYNGKSVITASYTEFSLPEGKRSLIRLEIMRPYTLEKHRRFYSTTLCPVLRQTDFQKFSLPGGNRQFIPD